jgi:hypothetical protein
MRRYPAGVPTAAAATDRRTTRSLERATTFASIACMHVTDSKGNFNTTFVDLVARVWSS